MVAGETLQLPLHELIARLQAWRLDPSDQSHEALRSSLARVASSYGADGAYLEADMEPIGSLSLGAGSLRALTDSPSDDQFMSRALSVGEASGVVASLWIDGPNAADEQLAEAVELSLSATWLEQETADQRQQLDALDAAVSSIATIGSVERVLQVIVDQVRDLVGAQYAALGIVGQFGHIDQFIVSGITPELRALLGAPPEGHGLLGLIIREDRPLLIDDISTDPRRHGFPEHHPPMRSLLGVPVRTRTRAIGNLYLTDKIGAPRFSEDDLRLVEKFALHAAIAIENARLHEEVGRLAIVDERQRISQDLHDSVIQSLYAISLSLEDVPDLMREDPAEGEARTDRAIDSIHAAIRDIRNFIMGLQPELLDGADLVTGVRTLTVEFAGNTMVDLEVLIDPELPDLAPEKSAHVLAVAREALSNIARHSGASRASIILDATDGAMRLVIGDNGRGFDTARSRSAAQRGLTNLAARAEAVGGSLTLTSAPDAGTRLELAIPLGGDEPQEETQEA